MEGPLWSLGIEVPLYALFPLIALLFVRDVRLGVLSLFAVSALYRWHIAQTGEVTQFFRTSALPAFLDLFGAGMLTAYLVLRARVRDWPIARMPRSRSAAFRRGVSSALIVSRATRRLAFVSYNLYLWHVPVLTTIDRHRHAFDGLPQPQLWLAACTAAALGAVGFLTTRFVERPFLTGGWRAPLRQLQRDREAAHSTVR